MTDSTLSEAAKAMGRIGGKSTLVKHGKKHFSQIAKDRNKKYWAEWKAQRKLSNTDKGQDSAK